MEGFPGVKEGTLPRDNVYIPASITAISFGARVSFRTYAFYPFSLWEKAGMRGMQKEEFLIFQSPHPNPLPQGEGTESHFA